MAEHRTFDPMVLESRLHYPETLDKTPVVGRAEATVAEEGTCMEITEAGAMGTSSLDLSQSPEQGDGTGTQVGEEHGTDTLIQPTGNGRTIPQQEQGDGSKKRKNWSDAETDLLIPAVASEKTKTRSRLDKKKLWEGVAERVPGRTRKECRRRMETLKKAYNETKEYCDTEGMEFAELNGADFAKMKLATRMKEQWYNLIRDHLPAKRSRAQGRGRCSTSGEAKSCIQHNFELSCMHVFLPGCLVVVGIWCETVA